MSTFPDDNDRADKAVGDFEHALKSLRPRATVDAQTILAQTRGEERTVSRPAARVREEVRRSPRQLTWPLLTALSWLITIGVWWTASPARGPSDLPMAGHQTHSKSPIIGNAARTIDDGASTGINQLGGLLTATNIDPPLPRDARQPVESRPVSEPNPFWLSLLGFNVEAFRVETAEDRWNRMQAQADVVANTGGQRSHSIEHESATYSSLRDEFNTPIRTDWFSR